MINNNLIIETEIKEKEAEKLLSFNSITGDTEYLYYSLKQSIKKASSIDIIVSFLMETGVKLIINDLKDALDRGVKIRILTGSYLKITQPQALYLIKEKLADKIDLRFYNNPNKSFHPKSYIFHYENNDGELYIGSSNISRGALTSSIEWNYRLNKKRNQNDFNHFYNTFENLFNNHSFQVTDEVLEEYSKTWIRPKIYNDLESLVNDKEDKIINIFEPRGAQIEALYSLNKSREEGYDKGLVVAATGIGKTYLSAFDSKKYNKILFVAHREEIIKQAQQSFKNVRPEKSTGLFYSNLKEHNKDIVLALVQTIGKEEYLNEKFFSKDYFDYIIIDEFHHAVAGNYKKIIDYFEPKFLLGLTATPERLDNKDVFSLCDYNIVYEIRLKEAINRGDLVPFRYYGIHDETINYEEVEFKNGKYDKNQLDKVLMINKRVELVFKHYEKYNSKKAMGFCSSKEHAEFMAKYFNSKGIKASAVYSGDKGEFSEERTKALNNLLSGEIKIIFSVDMFNEGVDIPSIDLVMFLRPTESPTVFLQQLGRGLRKSKGKTYLNVIDFIGNYKKANLIPFLLSGKNYNKLDVKNGKFNSYDYPEECMVDFDLKLIDIFKEQAQREMKLKDIIFEEFISVYEDLKHIPTRVEFFTYMDDDVYNNMKNKSNLNIFNDYMKFLNKENKLTNEEIEIFNSRAYNFINTIETTSMSKTYKMPILLAFYNRGNFKMSINDDDIYNSFKTFYENGSNGSDMLKDKSTKDYLSWDKKKYVKLAKNNPIKYLQKTHSDFFYTNSNGDFSIREDIELFINNKSFLNHVKDAIEFRCKEYYKNRFEKSHKRSK
ncbi:DEAD/DEAH box helicase family protein [Clostridium tarantellae]|uniref:NgoFVII family restriction endonuclease n=1 Tax=Clostridium tarantellae TaxID=39493 RepID=A0A6I1MLZ4_9CLOT|nr:DEAD/DEAH box helicase family protein [Clostridium tarantellae]MPQ44020.1 NgoFVII family restriction endonuclease [Clostridium tarantellae]